MKITYGLAGGINPPHLYAKAINVKVAGAIPLGTVPAGRIFAPKLGWVAIRAANGVSGVASIALGTNGPNYNNIMLATALTSLNDGEMAPMPFRPKWPYLTAGMQAYLNVTVAGVASGTYLIDMLIEGAWL